MDFAVWWLFLLHSLFIPSRKIGCSPISRTSSGLLATLRVGQNDWVFGHKVYSFLCLSPCLTRYAYSIIKLRVYSTVSVNAGLMTIALRRLKPFNLLQRQSVVRVL